MLATKNGDERKGRDRQICRLPCITRGTRGKTIDDINEVKQVEQQGRTSPVTCMPERALAMPGRARGTRPLPESADHDMGPRKKAADSKVRYNTNAQEKRQARKQAFGRGKPRPEIQCWIAFPHNLGMPVYRFCSHVLQQRDSTDLWGHVAIGDGNEIELMGVSRLEREIDRTPTDRPPGSP